MVTLDFQLTSVVARAVTVSVTTNPATTERFTLLPARTLPARFGPLPLPPGTTTLVFSTDSPDWMEPGPGGRPLAFSLHRLQVNVAQTP